MNLLREMNLIEAEETVIRAKRIVVERETCDCFVADEEMAVGKLVFANSFYEDFATDFDEDMDDEFNEQINEDLD